MDKKKKNLSERLYRQFSKCSGTECAAFGSWPVKCTNAVKQSLNTRRNGQKEEGFVRKAVAYEMLNCCEAIAKQ